MEHLKWVSRTLENSISIVKWGPRRKRVKQKIFYGLSFVADILNVYLE